MFTCSCLTCEAKLVVKDDGLVGKIVPCPKCGSMVAIQHAEIAPPPKVAVHKRFPDVLTHETASGIIKPAEEDIRSSSMLLNSVPAPDTDIADKEVKTRMMLLNILIGLSVCLLATLGFLMVFQNPAPDSPPIVSDEPMGDEPFFAVPAHPLPFDTVEEPIHEPPLHELPDESELTDAIPITELMQVPSDDLAIIDDRMLGFVNLSVPNIDIDARLALPIREFQLDRESLIAFIRVLSRLTGIPITLDIDEMKAHGLSAQTPVSGQYREMTAGEILTQTLESLDLQWLATERQILVYPNMLADVELLFDVSDITVIPVEDIAEMIQKLVVPDGNITVQPGAYLHVVQTANAGGKSPARIRDEIIRFLEQFRFIRQLSPQTDWPGEKIAPEAFGWDRVMMPITFNHYRPVSLDLLVQQLEEQTGLTILVDHQSLHRESVSFSALRASVQSDDGMLNDVLEQMLASVDSATLAYRIIDHQTLEITTAQSARQPEKMSMEVHHYQMLEEELPTLPPGGAIVIDVPSNCLFIRQSQPVHRQIRLYLAENAILEP